MKRLLALLIPSLVLTACGGGTFATFAAAMNGANEVPAVTTNANGTATFDVQGQQARFIVTAFDMSSNVTAAHIHGPAGSGVNAGIIVTLFSGTAPAPVNGQLVQGTFGPSNIEPASGVVWDQLIELMRTGGAYVNVHTTAFPAGEIRGQIRIRTGLEDR